MKPKIACLLLLIAVISQSFLGFSRTAVIYPIFDSNRIELQKLRTSQVKAGKPGLNLRGLNCIRASGSEQFSEATFAEMVKSLSIQPENLVVFDLRQESHGFINGKSICWTDGNYNYANLHKTRSEIEMDEYQRLRLAAQARRIVIDPANSSTKLTVHSVKTERDVVEGIGSTYIRLPVTDHNRPTNQAVDQFIALITNLPQDRWVHFHCRGGKGRTSTFLTLYDIVKNSQNVALDEILARQKFIGGYDLNYVQRGDSERSRAYHERLEFVQKFYLYCRQVPDFQISWTDWVERENSIALNL